MWETSSTLVFVSGRIHFIPVRFEPYVLLSLTHETQTSGNRVKTKPLLSCTFKHTLGGHTFIYCVLA